MRERAVPPQKVRSSNIELMRIVLMVVIIMHHYVVNTGIMDGVNMRNLTANAVFLQYWGMWGKMAINAYVMVSGYFLCTSRLTWQKYVKLLLEILFYSFVIYALMVCLGYATLSVKEIGKTAFGLLHGAGAGFAASFMMFYLFVPFLNQLISSTKMGGMERLLVLLFFVNTVTVTFFLSNAFNEISWYMNIYFVGAYLRLYAGAWSRRLSFAVKWLAIFLGLSFLSVAAFDVVGVLFHRDAGWWGSYYFVNDSSKILAFFVSVCVFLVFKNLPLGHSHAVNVVARTTFGVLLIHAHSDAERMFLWHDLAHVPEMIQAPFGELVLHAAGWAILVFVVCSMIDYLRLRYLEPSVMNWLYRHSEWIEARTVRLVQRSREFLRRMAA